MATLNSPGAVVTVIDESFYTPAEPGTVPLIVVATGQDKKNGAGTGTAAATLKANAGKAYKVTSQRDLVDLFGVPFFEKTASATPIHGGERNEYGLLAAYSLLGVSNAAFIVRADVDLSQLAGTTAAPGAEATDGQWWVDTATTLFGVFEWNGNKADTTGGQKFTNKKPLVLTKEDSAKIDVSNDRSPKESIGVTGDYAVVIESDQTNINLFYRRDKKALGLTTNPWVLVGSNDWIASNPTVAGSRASNATTTAGSFVLNGNTITVTGGQSLASIAANIGSLVTGVTAKVVSGNLNLYSNGATEVDGDSTRGGAIKITSESTTGVVASIFGSAVVVNETYYPPRLQVSPHTQVPSYKRGDNADGISTAPTMTFGRPSGSVWVKTTEANLGAKWKVKRWSAATKTWVEYTAPLYANGHAALYYLDRTGGGLNIATNSLFVQYNSDEQVAYTSADTTVGVDEALPTAAFKVWRRANTGSTTITSAVVAGLTITTENAYSFTISEFVRGTLSTTLTPTTISFAGAADQLTAANQMAAAINSAGLTHIEAVVTTEGKVQISHKTGGDFRLTDGDGTPLSLAGFSASTTNLYTAPAGATEDFVASNWQPLEVVGYTADTTGPLNEAKDGQLWYNPAYGEVDIMVHDGAFWRGYRHVFPGTDPAGPIVSATKPTTYADGVTPIAGAGSNGQLWISTADLENFPTIYRWNGNTLEWDLLDKTDQTTEDGILFADARAGVDGGTADTAPSGTIAELALNDFLDFDAPDPDLYPKGMLLWNLRRSGGNVKKYKNNAINLSAENARFKASGLSSDVNVYAGTGDSMADYYPDRWMTASANQEDGSGTFGRKAQRAVVIAALKSVTDTSAEIRDEERRNFNLIAAPGYPELLSNLINLNIDRGITAFVVGDTPFRLPADATSLTNWGTNANGALDNNEVGIVSYDEYAAVFYPSGFTTDLGGTSAVVPSSHMMLKTIALSDQVSYPWFAPAGTRRGGITNATSVGYIDKASGEFQVVSLNEGQRDTLYNVNVNPITFFNGVGLVNYGQKTRARNASALDRINVARLVCYLRSQLNKLARPYIFEPNDKITRDEIKQAVESLLLELVGLRALYDFAVVCDESNNTPSRIDRNELYVDIAIEPVKAVEFIYIPLRVKNTGEI